MAKVGRNAVDVFPQMPKEMDAVMKKLELLALAATLRIPSPCFGRPWGARLLGPQLHRTFKGAEPNWIGSWGMPRAAADEEVL